MNFNVPFGSASHSRNPSAGFSKGPVKSILSHSGSGKPVTDQKRSVIVTTPGKSGLTFSVSPMKSGSHSLQSRLKQETFSSAMKKNQM